MSSKRTKYTPSRPSAYTPFRRWFTDERAREVADSKKLFSEVSRLRSDGLLQEVYEGIFSEVRQRGGLPAHLEDELTQLGKDLLILEDAIFVLDEPDWKALSMKEAAEHRMLLRAQEHFLRNKERCVDLLVDTIAGTLHGLGNDLPEPAQKPLLRVPRCFLVDDLNELIAIIIDTYMREELDDNGILYELRRQFYLNLCNASGLVPDQEHKKPFVAPADKGLPPLEAVRLYLNDTPFERLLLHWVDIPIPEDTLFSHMHIVGGSGAGKTSWLGQLILHHLKDPKRPSLVVVDSQSALIPPVSTLSAIQDRLLYIDPRDPPAINVFDGEGAIEMMDYLFESIVGAALTPKQSVFFNFVAELMVSIPGATMLDVLRVMRDPAAYSEHMRALPELAREFFENDFNSSTFRDTKEQVRYRLNSLLRNRSLRKILTSPNTEIDLEAALNNGAVILIDTSKEYLKGVSPQFGRIFIALILRALYNRFPTPEHKRYPTYLIVDEAHEYFDQNIDELLTQVRKLKCGCVFAHQYLGQCTAQLRESLAANTAIRMAAGVSVPDARVLAPALRTTAESILSQPPLTFAAYIRNRTAQAIPVEVTPGLLGRESHVRVRQSTAPQPKESPVTTPEAPTTPPTPDDIDTDASDSW